MLSRSPGVDSGVALFVTSNAATFSISRKVSQENRDKPWVKAEIGDREQPERRRESNRKAKRKLGIREWKQREVMSGAK